VSCRLKSDTYLSENVDVIVSLILDRSSVYSRELSGIRKRLR